MLILMNLLRQATKLVVLTLSTVLLAACGIATPMPTITATVTLVPSLTPSTPSITPSPIPTITSTPDVCNIAQGQDGIRVMSGLLFVALEPGGPVVFDRILAEQNPGWADFRQSDHGEIRSAGVIFHETAFGPELGTGVNPAVLLVTYGVDWNWELPANGDLVSEVDLIRATLHQHESDWILGKVNQSQYPPIANAATYSLYRYFNGDLSKLEDWSSNFETLFGFPQSKLQPGYQRLQAQAVML